MLLRLFSCACVALGLGFGGYTSTSRLATSPPSTRWVLRSLDGKILPNFQSTAQPELVLPGVHLASSTPSRGSFQHSISARLQTIPHVISTMMRCSNQAIEVELRYLSALEHTNRFEIRGDTLHLYAAQQATPLATFEAVSRAL